MENTPSRQEFDALKSAVNVLQAEADIRRIMGRYNMLCDVPLPEQGHDLESRIGVILELFSDDATWEGVGGAHEQQFGKSVGREQLTQHFRRFFGPGDKKMVLNVHYLTSEQIHVYGEDADGQWVHFQPWVFDDGSSFLRSSRTNNNFKLVNGVWKMSHYRTENIFVAPLQSGWATKMLTETVLMKRQN
jgi:hypothetical protein